MDLINMYRGLLFYFLAITQGLDCLVTLTMTTLQCQNYCLNKYASSKPFFNQSSSFCTPYIVCPSGLFLNISSNACFNGTGTTTALSLSATEIPNVVNGYLNAFGVAVCNLGWTSSCKLWDLCSIHSADIKYIV